MNRLDVFFPFDKGIKDAVLHVSHLCVLNEAQASDHSSESNYFVAQKSLLSYGCNGNPRGRICSPLHIPFPKEEGAAWEETHAEDEGDISESFADTQEIWSAAKSETLKSQQQ